jgi:hypothetical protein
MNNILCFWCVDSGMEEYANRKAVAILDNVSPLCADCAALYQWERECEHGDGLPSPLRGKDWLFFRQERNYCKIEFITENV